MICWAGAFGQFELLNNFPGKYRKGNLLANAKAMLVGKTAANKIVADKNCNW